jgi:arylsulfatase A-like enzyme
MKPFLPFAAFNFLMASLAALHAGEIPQSKANIVFILADDLGWKDLGCYGSYAYQTPHIDRLAAEGVRFTRAHAYPSCSPTRSGLMTGMDPARLGIFTPAGHEVQVILQPTLPAKGPKWERELTPSIVTRLDTKFITYARVLKEAGYVTGHFGKWHLGREPYSPLQHGFDVDIPHTPNPGPSGSYINPWNKDIAAGFTLPAKPGDHLEDHLAQEACAFIEKNKDHPFLLNYWAFSVHSPLNAKDNYIEQYRAIADSDHPQRNPVYAAMVRSLDDAVGTLLDCLEKNGLSDRTIVVFSSDNGGLGFFDNGGMAHKEYQGNPATSNAPLRGGKGMNYEGGTRVPLIVKWPGVAKSGTVTSALEECMDIFPTFVEMAGQSLPKQPLDGYSLVPVLKGTKPSVRTKVFCIQPTYLLNYSPPIYAPSASIIQGDWKFIRFYGDNPDGSNREELYNLKDDIGETFDDAPALPDISKKLSKNLDDYLARIEVVLPKPNPNFDATVVPPARIRKPSEPLVPPPDDGD